MKDYINYRRSELERRVERGGFGVLDVMVTGVTGAGKSTTLNTLFQKEVAQVGDGTDPMTMELDSYAFCSTFRLWDTPGLGDGEAADLRHSKKLIQLLNKAYGTRSEYGWIDLVIVIVDGSTRDMGTVYHLVNDIVLQNIEPCRVLAAINQADMAMSGRHWDAGANCPDAVLSEFLREKASSVQSRIREATGLTIPMPVCYSAEKDYNIPALLDLIVDSVPTRRRSLCG